MSRTTLLLTTAVIVLGGAFVLGKWGQSRPATGDDAADIANVIENATELRGEACLERSHGQEQYFKDQVAPYWSDVPPTGEELQNRNAHFATFYSTPDPTAVAESVATTEALLQVGDSTVSTTTLQALQDFDPPTPSWDPTDSPREARFREIDRCQADFGKPGMSLDFGVLSYDYQDISIDGDEAEATVDIAMWGDIRTPLGSTGPLTDTERVTFRLAREGGVWRIRGESYQFEW